MDAAFFACYLDRTYRQILRRRLIVEALTEGLKDGTVWRVQDLVRPVRRLAEEAWLFGPESSEQEKTDETWKWIMLELLALDRRNSLEGLGILAFRLVKPSGWPPPNPLLASPWELTPEETWLLYSLLLETFRWQGTMSFPDAVSPKDEEFAPRNRPYYFRHAGSSPRNGIYSWSPSKAGLMNRRLDLLNRLLRRSFDCIRAHLLPASLTRPLLFPASGEDHIRGNQASIF